MVTNPTEPPASKKGRPFTLACRIVCSVLVAAPAYYLHFVNASAVGFLILLLIAPVAGLVLIANSVFGWIRHRAVEHWWIGALFVVVGLMGFVQAWYYLPQFRM